MIRPDSDARIHLYRDAVDMRKSITVLVAIVEAEMALDVNRNYGYAKEGHLDIR